MKVSEYKISYFDPGVNLIIYFGTANSSYGANKVSDMIMDEIGEGCIVYIDNDEVFKIRQRDPKFCEFNKRMPKNEGT